MSRLNLRHGGLIQFRCPACNSAHMLLAQINEAKLAVPDAGDPDWTPPQEYYEARNGAWSWNGDQDRPSFQPSILVTYPGADAGANGAPPAVCHSFVTDGRIQFLGDCTHSMAGLTVDLPEWRA